MNLYKTIFFLLIVILSQEVMCQDKIEILPKGENDFKYQNRLYQNFQLDSILVKKKNAYKKYKNFKRTKKAGKLFSRTSIVFAVALIAENLRDATTGDEVYTINEQRFAFGCFLSGSIGLLLNSNAKYKRKDAIQIFNSESGSPPKIGATPLDINLGFTSAGLGIRFSF